MSAPLLHVQTCTCSLVRMSPPHIRALLFRVPSTSVAKCQEEPLPASGGLRALVARRYGSSLAPAPHGIRLACKVGSLPVIARPAQAEVEPLERDLHALVGLRAMEQKLLSYSLVQLLSTASWKYWQRKVTAAVLNSLPQHPALRRGSGEAPGPPLRRGSGEPPARLPDLHSGEALASWWVHELVGTRAGRYTSWWVHELEGTRAGGYTSWSAHELVGTRSWHAWHAVLSPRTRASDAAPGRSIVTVYWDSQPDYRRYQEIHILGK